ncbi:hypothetical protein [Aeromonas enteropelogenes]|uniref:hypothetical protein n=2 Tax=Aeromonas TaxID=642 RepID=UPI0030CBEBE3
MKQTISNYQSIFQLLAAIYLVAEWVSLERINGYYQKKLRDLYRYRFKVNQKYSHLIKDIFEEFEQKEWAMNYPRALHKNYSTFKLICWLFFTLSFSALLLSSFYPTHVIPHWQAGLFIIFLLMPFFWAILALIKPVYNQHNRIVSMFETALIEIEQAIKDYKQNNPEPTLNDAWKKRDEGDVFAVKDYIKSKQKFNEELTKYMKERFE